MNAFFQRVTRECLGNGESFIAVVEVCGFNDWLIRMLKNAPEWPDRQSSVSCGGRPYSIALLRLCASPRGHFPTILVVQPAFLNRSAIVTSSGASPSPRRSG